MKKTHIILSLIILIAIGLFLFSKWNQSNTVSDPNTTPSFVHIPGMSDDSQNSLSFSDDVYIGNDDKPDFQEFTEALLSGKTNFVWEVWSLRRTLCTEDTTPDACEAKVLAYLKNQIPAPDNQEFLKLFEDYFQYEDEIRKLKMSSDLNFETRYDLIKNKRKELFPDKVQKLLFGMEESQVELLDSTKTFLKETSNLSGDERVKKYFAMKKSTLGPYYENVVKREDPYQIYNFELDLRSKDFTKMKSDDREKKQREIDEKYFGKATAQELAKQRELESTKSKMISDLEIQEKEFLAKNPNLSPEKKQEKLNEMRIQALGPEEAGYYNAQKTLEEAEKGL
jgi:hypothetical protein